MSKISDTWSKGTLLSSLILLACIFTGSIGAAPHAIEGEIAVVENLTQKIKDYKKKYVFTGMDVISIGLVGQRLGKEFKYFKYMIFKDSTKLEGISFDGLKKGVYIRSRSRSEPPGMKKNPPLDINLIRESRFGCHEYSLHIDTIFTPRDITGSITNVEKISSTELAVTVRENKTSAREFKYLIVDKMTTIKNGSFSSIKAPLDITISQASIDMPSKGIYEYCAILYSADLYAPNVIINKVGIISENKQEFSNFLNCGSSHSTVYTITGRKIAAINVDNVLNGEMFEKKSISKQTLILRKLNGNKTVKKINLSEQK